MDMNAMPSERDTRPSPPSPDEEGRHDPPPSIDAEQEPTLAALVVSVTRRTPDAALASMVIAGVLGSAVIALLAPEWWRAAPLFLLLFAAGAWGIADRERESIGPRGVAFRVAGAIALIASLGAVAMLILMLFGPAIGRWVS